MSKYQATDEQIKQVAQLAFTGMAIEKIARSVGTSSAIVKSNIMADPRFDAEYRDVLAKTSEAVKEVYKEALADLMPLAINRLKEALKPGSRDGMVAVQTVLRTSGLMSDESGTPLDTKLTVILPGANSDAQDKTTITMSPTIKEQE